MTNLTPQGTRARPCSPLIAAVALAVSVVSGCRCTAPRGKPWRHEPDPKQLAAAEPPSPALTDDVAASDAAILSARAHTLRVICLDNSHTPQVTAAPVFILNNLVYL